MKANNIPKLLDELSFLSRETNGASFNIQHCKDNGLYKVVFNNCMVRLKHDPLARETDFETALENGIKFIKQTRRPVEQPVEKYTMY